MSIYSHQTRRAPGFGSRGVQSNAKDDDDTDYSAASINRQPVNSGFSGQQREASEGGGNNTGTFGGQSNDDEQDSGKSKGPGIGISTTDVGWGAATVGAGIVGGPVGAMAVQAAKGITQAVNKDPSDYATPGINPNGDPSSGFTGTHDPDDQAGKDFGINDARQTPDQTTPTSDWGQLSEEENQSMSEHDAGVAEGNANSQDNAPGGGLSGVNAGIGALGTGGQGGIDSAGDGTGGGDTRVICTELVRQGLMPKQSQLRDLRFTQQNLSRTHIRGYHYWAIPTVRLMKRSKGWARFWRFIAQHRANEISYQMGHRDKPDYIGKIMRLFFEPFCFCVGLLAPGSGVLSPDEIKERIK